MKNLRALIGGAWGILALWYMFYLLPNDSTLANILAFIGFFVSALIGVMTQTKHPWSTWVVTCATTFMGLLRLLVINADHSEGLLALVLCIVTVIFTWTKTTRAELHATVDWRHNAKSFGVAVLGISGLAMLLGFGISEAGKVQSSVQKQRMQSNCEDINVDLEACGQLGIAQVTSPVDEKELVAGRDLLDAMCKNGHPVACRRAVFARMAWQFDDLPYLDLPKELWARCQKEGGTACMALALGEYILPDDFGTVARAKCSADDRDACVAWAASADWDLDEAHTKSCQNGVKGSCTVGGVPINVREDACKMSQDPWTCFVSTGYKASALYCNQGVWPACAPETWPKKRWHQITWAERLVIEPSDMTPSWQNLRLGRQALQKSNFGWPPAPMTLTEIDETFGAACDAGNAYGCTEGANAAVNVAFKLRTQERIDHAVKSLNTGCKNGDYLACWFLLSVVKVSPEQAMTKARDACYAAPRGVRLYPEICRTYVHLWMAEVGITPWVMDSTLARPEMMSTCAQQRDRFLCQAISVSTTFELSTPQPLALPQYAVGLDAAQIACSQNSPRGCTEFLDIARAWPSTTNESPEGLAKDICAKIPTMCDTVNKHIKSKTPRK